jgi:colanic acid biosynthesis glycosyl transferase WcaI
MNVLLLNQAFHPDVVSTAQHASGLAAALADRGHHVTVICSSRGYDDPNMKFSKHEMWRGVQILRVTGTHLGKAARWRRALDFASFMLNCGIRMLRLPRMDVVIALTSPPLISFLAALMVRIRGGRFLYWVMDLNPDEAIAAGWLKEGSAVTRTLQAIQRHDLQTASDVVVLDRFMKTRVVAHGADKRKLAVIPPWSQDSTISFDPHGREEFRKKYSLGSKFVVMYSGNHSPCHPLKTLLEAALRLREHENVAFCFVGGGSEFKTVQSFATEHGLQNIRCLPYQPLSELSASLSAADIHAVVMGNEFVGMIHPCKVYNVLAVGRPLLYIGPSESHVSDILQQSRELSNASVIAKHGEVDVVVKGILQNAGCLNPRGSYAQIAAGFSDTVLIEKMITVVEHGCEALVEDQDVPTMEALV